MIRILVSFLAGLALLCITPDILSEDLGIACLTEIEKKHGKQYAKSSMGVAALRGCIRGKLMVQSLQQESQLRSEESALRMFRQQLRLAREQAKRERFIIEWKDYTERRIAECESSVTGLFKKNKIAKCKQQAKETLKNILTPPRPQLDYGGDLDCEDFQSQEQAQDHLARNEYRDSYNLDADDDGIACEHLP